jgi:hypothetical protein
VQQPDIHILRERDLLKSKRTQGEEKTDMPITTAKRQCCAKKTLQVNQLARMIGAARLEDKTFARAQRKEKTRVRPNGSRYRRLEGRDSPTKRSKPVATKKSQFDGENPAVRVHAVLASLFVVNLFYL